MDLSIVTSMYNSAPFVEEFYERISRVAKKVADHYEIILVNDGSLDESLTIAARLCDRDSHIRVIDLSRNFGHHKALLTGLAYAKGERIFLIDCDLEEDPELLLHFQEEFDSTGADVVYGVQERRKGSLIERIGGFLFYQCFNTFSSWKVPKNLSTVRLMSHRYVKSLLAFREREVAISGLWAMTGYLQLPLVITKRQKRVTTYNFIKKVALTVNMLTSFTSFPLVLVFYLGCVIVFLSSIAAFWLIIRHLFFGALMTGWPSLIVSIWLLGGLGIFCIGVIGIYISKIFSEVKRRPYTIIRQVYGDGNSSKNG